MTGEKERWFTVGELARRGGVTVRTLQYYDKCGLLSPSEYSEGGRRMYVGRDIIRLQQILFLKSMGFSLEEIRDQVLPAESPADLSRLLEGQKRVLLEQLSQIRQTVDQIDQIIEEVRLGREANIDRLLLVMRGTRTGNPYFFLNRHLDREQADHLYQRFDEESAAAFNQQMRKFTDKLVELFRRGEPPDGTEGQRLAEEWWTLMVAATEGDLSLIPKMASAIVDETHWPAGSEELRTATLTFLRQAVQTFMQANQIKLR